MVCCGIIMKITWIERLSCFTSVTLLQVMTQIAENGINLYSLPDCDEDEDEDYREQCRLLKVRRSTGNRHMSLIEFIDVIMVSSVKTGNK